jgi:hypothetical protein
MGEVETGIMARRRDALRIKLQVEKKTPGFGTMKGFLFKDQVLKKVREDLPKELTDFSSAKGSESYVGVDSPGLPGRLATSLSAKSG